MWIEHPALDEPVSLRRWLIWKVSVRLNCWAMRMYWRAQKLEHLALYNEHWVDDDLPF